MILVFSDLWPPFPGGAERLAFNLARDLMRRGETVQVVTGYEHAQQFDGPPVLSRPIGVFETHEIGAAVLAAALVAFKPDLILVHHLYAYEFERELLDSGIPLIQVILNTRRIEGIALGVYISKWVRDTTDATLPHSQPDDLIIRPPAFDDVIAERHGDYIGHIKPLPHKGVELIYKLAAALPDREFLILRGEWQDLEDIRPAANVRFMQPVTDIRDFYRECRILLMPSLSEDAGTVSQEAALNGLPCISSNVGGLAETNGGIQLDPDDLGAWVCAIQLLDGLTIYNAVVQQQREHFERSNQDALLDLFAERVAALRQRRD